MDKICLVFDIDETILHYGPNDYFPKKFDYEEGLLFEKDRMVIRPGLQKFIDYVNSQNEDSERIILGIWTYGTKEYADAVAKRIEETYNNSEKLFKFVYSRENMSPGMLDKELEFVISNNADLEKETTFLIDNRPANIYHNKNRSNGIIVESFEGKKTSADDKMFKSLQQICKSLLNTAKVPRKYIKDFLVSGSETPIANIGDSFDDGFTPIRKTKTTLSIKKTPTTTGGYKTRKQKRFSSRV
jgi:hypothetical protein